MIPKQRPIATWPGVALAAAGLIQWFLSLFGVAAGLTGFGTIAIFAGVFWIGLAGWRVIGHGLFFALAVLILGLKFGTVEIVYLDRPMVGVALTWPPTLASRYLAPTADALSFFFVMGPSDGGFAGRALYWTFALWAWLVLPLLWLVARLFWWRLGKWFRLDVPLPRKRKAARSKRGRRKRLVSYGFGYLFIFLGVLGLFLPILQGILFLVIGFLFLGRVSPRTRLSRMRLRRRYPKWAAKYDAVEGKARDWIRRRFGRKKSRDDRGRTAKPVQ